MKSKFIILTLAALVLSSGYAFAEDKKGSAKEEKVQVKNADASVEVPKFCPLCGPEEELHGTALGYKYKGKKYKFCSMTCLKAFKKDPEGNLKNLAEGNYIGHDGVSNESHDDHDDHEYEGHDHEGHDHEGHDHGDHDEDEDDHHDHEH